MGICEICQSKTAVVKCQICKRNICMECLSTHEGICSLCAGSICSICNTNLAARACNVCGNLVCGSCSIKEGEATICERCHKNQR